MAVKSSHVHKLKRLRYKSGNEIFFCTLPDCTYKTNIALALGKRSICHRCGSEFLMDEYSLRLAKPHCPQCHKPKNQMPTLDEIIVFDDQAQSLMDGRQPFLENREIKQEEIPGELSLFDRLRATISNAQKAVQEANEEI
jgi:hypothetical protein